MKPALDETRERLLEAAGEVFAEYGFRAATIRDICLRGKANVAAVNYHFGDKHTLYIETVQRAHCMQAGQLSIDWPVDVTPEQKLRGFVSQWLKNQLAEDRPSWHTRLMLREMADPTDACVKLVEAYIRPMAEMLRGIIRELIPAPLEQRQEWMIGFSIVSQCLFYKVHRPVAELLVGRDAYAQLNLDVLADHIARFSLAALGCGLPVVERSVTAEHGA